MEPTDSIKPGDYVLVKFEGKKDVRPKHFAGLVTSTDDSIITVSFFKTVQGSTNVTFIKAEVDDIADVDKCDIVMVLPSPNITGGTSRLSERMLFAVDLTKFFMN